MNEQSMVNKILTMDLFFAPFMIYSMSNAVTQQRMKQFTSTPFYN
jgi:hypothetical protein